jgi:hypothetical protein
MVYNRRFIKDNFEQPQIGGIFTLGAKDIGIREHIDECNEKLKE